VKDPIVVFGPFKGFLSLFLNHECAKKSVCDRNSLPSASWVFFSASKCRNWIALFLGIFTWLGLGQSNLWADVYAFTNTPASASLAFASNWMRVLPLAETNAAGYVNIFNTQWGFLSGKGSAIADLRASLGSNGITLSPNFAATNAPASTRIIQPFLQFIQTNTEGFTIVLRGRASSNGLASQLYNTTTTPATLTSGYSVRLYLQAQDRSNGFASVASTNIQLGGTNTWSAPSLVIPRQSNLAVTIGTRLEGLNIDSASASSFGGVTLDLEAYLLTTNLPASTDSILFGSYALSNASCSLNANLTVQTIAFSNTPQTLYLNANSQNTNAGATFPQRSLTLGGGTNAFGQTHLIATSTNQTNPIYFGFFSNRGWLRLICQAPATISVGHPSGVLYLVQTNGSTNTGCSLEGTQGLIKSGPGTLVLGSSNALTGPISVLEGTLSITNGGSLNAASGLTFAVDSSNANKLVLDSGGALQAGGVLQLNVNPSLGAGSYPVFSLNGTVAGNFSSTNITGQNPAFDASLVNGVLLLQATTNRLPVGSFSTWLALKKYTGTNALPSADPDGNGLSNLLEYSMLGSAYESSPAESILPIHGQTNGYLFLSYLRRTNDASLAVRAEYSRDLTSGWVVETLSGGPVALATNAVSGGEGVEVLVRAPVPMSATNRGFLRAVTTRPSGSTLVVGSSIMERWTNIVTDLSPVPISNKGASGSTTVQWLPGAPENYWGARVTNNVPAPSALIYYCGSNDISLLGSPPAVIFSNTVTFMNSFWALYPDTPVLYLSVIRAPEKKNNGWVTQVDQVNALIQTWSLTESRIRFLDVNPALVDSSGNALDAGYFLSDGLHLTVAGYQRMSEWVRPVLNSLWYYQVKQ
jgi:autotransporter-associated beta strand protein